MDVRRPSVAGQFYSGSSEGLREQIEASFQSELGPGLPEEGPGSSCNVLGIVVPHAGYVYSGPVAAWSYRRLFADRSPDSFVILGPNHHGVGSGVSMYPKGSWETPLGIARIDEGLSRAISEATGIIDLDERAHTYEHSIEVQVPFLQYLYGDVEIVPISLMLQDLETSLEVGRDIAKALANTDRRPAILASTDFSHYVSPEVAHENDHLAIERITSMDSAGLYRVVRERDISMCGFGPVMATIEATSNMGATEGHLLKYATSGDVMPMRDVVGYGAISLERT
jgi:AmmeMemoRadiSam system protein B